MQDVYRGFLMESRRIGKEDAAGEAEGKAEGEEEEPFPLNRHREGVYSSRAYSAKGVEVLEVLLDARYFRDEEDALGVKDKTDRFNCHFLLSLRDVFR